MLKQCPECGSTEIILDLLVYTDEALSGERPPYVSLLEPEPSKRPFVWMPKSVSTGFRAAICGACGHTLFYTQHQTEILEAHKKGCKSQTYSQASSLPCNFFLPRSGILPN